MRSYLLPPKKLNSARVQCCNCKFAVFLMQTPHYVWITSKKEILKNSVKNDEPRITGNRSLHPFIVCLNFDILLALYRGCCWYCEEIYKVFRNNFCEIGKRKTLKKYEKHFAQSLKVYFDRKFVKFSRKFSKEFKKNCIEILY